MKRLLILAVLLAGCSKPKPPAIPTGAYSQFTPSFCGDYYNHTTWPLRADGICYAEDDPAVTSNAPSVSISPKMLSFDEQIALIQKKVNLVQDCLRQTPELWKQNNCEERVAEMKKEIAKEPK